jgi:hypothetical protein
MAFLYKNTKGTNYFLHSMEVTLKNSKRRQRIYWFAPKTGKNAIDELPKGYKITQNKRTGLPVLKKG